MSSQAATCWATRHPIEARLLFRFEFARTFGDVRDDRACGTVDLVSDVGASSGQVLTDLVAQLERFEGAVVHVELLVVEGHTAPSARPSGWLRQSPPPARAGAPGQGTIQPHPDAVGILS